MNRGEFLHELRVKLAALPEEDVDRTVFYYSEIIDDMTEDGKTEEEAVAELESVDEIAQRIISETPVRAQHSQVQNQVPDVQKKKSSSGIVILVVLICTFPIWIGLFVSAWSIAISFFPASVACILAGIVGIPASFIVMADGLAVKGIFMLGTCLFTAGLGLIWLIGNIYYTKALVKLICFICRKIKASF